MSDTTNKYYKIYALYDDVAQCASAQVLRLLFFFLLTGSMTFHNEQKKRTNKKMKENLRERDMWKNKRFLEKE